MMKNSSELPIIALVGPTGTGKSALAISLAQRLGGECVNADSMQFYRGMDIGTAKVSVEEMQGVPHHLLDTLDITQEASVADFQQQARQVFTEIRARGNYPILVGGSGLYVRAALDRLEFPGTDPVVRARLEKEAAQQGIGRLHERLTHCDPESAARVHDARRIIRALEVFEVTGRPFSAFMPVREYVSPAVQIGLMMDRQKLHQRLHQRVVAMAESGLLGEVRTLEKHGLRDGKTASRAIGYAQFLKVLDSTRHHPEDTLGKPYTLQNAIEDTATATRQFARRQITWFRADDRVHWLHADSEHLLEEALAVVHDASESSYVENAGADRP